MDRRTELTGLEGRTEEDLLDDLTDDGDFDRAAADDPTDPAHPERRRLIEPPLWLRTGVLCALLGFVVSQLHLGLIFTDTTPTGGDVGAHVWFPAFLRDSLLPSLGGWSDDWFAGFPAGTFYFPLPALVTVALSTLVSYNIAFKIVLVAGTIMLPLACYRLGRSAKLGSPTPELMAAASVVFAMDRFHTIYGGNAASALAGMFSLSLGLSLALLFAADLIETAGSGRHPSRTALLAAAAALSHLLAGVLVAVLAVLIVIWTPRRLRAMHRSAPPLLVGAALTGCWSLPFVANLAQTTDMGYERVTDVTGYLLPFLSDTLARSETAHMWALALLVPAGAVLAARSNDVVGRVLVSVVVLFAALFALWPTGPVWNTRWLPYYYLGAYLLAAYALGALVRIALSASASHRRGWSRGPALGSLTVVLAAVVTLPAVLPAGILPSFVPGAAPRGATSTVSGWASWDLSGYESKSSADEYQAVMAAMDEVGARRGCGRALWEYDSDQGSYGTPMAMMLLPYWTNGCIDSLEGLFMEGSRTTPFHFLTQSGVSQTASTPVRGLPYRGFDLSWGVPAMRELGVRYYMAFNDASATAALARDDLEPVVTSGPWRVFELVDWELVTALDHEPTVLEGAWPDVAATAFADARLGERTYAYDGPARWERRPAVATTPVRPVEPAVLSNVKMTSGHVSFDVDQPGKAVLVRQSYFPSWHAEGADGPYPAGANMMVVVPTGDHVELTIGPARGTKAGFALSALGVVALAALMWSGRRRVSAPSRRREGQQ